MTFKNTNETWLNQPLNYGKKEIKTAMPKANFTNCILDPNEKGVSSKYLLENIFFFKNYRM